jgi:hypothetical protein
MTALLDPPVVINDTDRRPRHRSQREQLPPFILGMLTFLAVYAATTALTHLPASFAPPIASVVLTGVIVWAYSGSTS